MDEYLELLVSVLAMVAVVGVAGLVVGIMYLVEEGFKNTVNSIFNLFENNHGGVVL